MPNTAYQSRLAMKLPSAPAKGSTPLRLATHDATQMPVMTSSSRMENGPVREMIRIASARNHAAVGVVGLPAGVRQYAAIVNWRNHCALVIVPKISPLVGTARKDKATIQMGR